MVLEDIFVEMYNILRRFLVLFLHIFMVFDGGDKSLIKDNGELMS